MVFPHGITTTKLPGPSFVTFKQPGPMAIVKPDLLPSSSSVAGSDAALPASAASAGANPDQM